MSSPIPIVYPEKTEFGVMVEKVGRTMHARVFSGIKCIFAKTANLMMTFSYKHVHICQNIKHVEFTHRTQLIP